MTLLKQEGELPYEPSNFVPNKQKVEASMQRALANARGMDGIHISRVEFVKKPIGSEYFATIGLEDGTKALRIINVEYKTQGGKYNPAREFESAIDKIVRKEPLEFQQEYAVEGVWHEMLHMKAIGWDKQKYAENWQFKLMESMNQLRARHTYEDLLRALGGGKPRCKDKVIKHGYAYEQSLENLRRIIKGKVSEKAFVKQIGKNLFDCSYGQLINKISPYLEKKGIKDANLYLRQIGLSPNIFKEIITSGV